MNRYGRKKSRRLLRAVEEDEELPVVERKLRVRAAFVIREFDLTNAGREETVGRCVGTTEAHSPG